MFCKIGFKLFMRSTFVDRAHHMCCAYQLKVINHFGECSGSESGDHSGIIHFNVITLLTKNKNFTELIIELWFGRSIS